MLRHSFAKRYDPQAGVQLDSINYAVTHEHTGNAIKVLHCIEVLDILRGVMDTPGGHRAATRAASVNVDQSTNIIGQYLRTGDAKANPATQQPYYDTKTVLTIKGDADATHCFRSIGEGIPFQTHGAIAEAGQVLNQSNISEAFEAMKKLDFFVDSNLWEDPISSLADIMLPEQHWMEVPFATRCTQGSNGFYGAHIRCIQPLGECRFGNDWIAELYKIHGTPFWNRADGGDPWEWEDYLMNRAVQSTGMTWQEYVKEFLENGWIDARKANPNGWGCYRRFQTGWMNLGKPGYGTNTTRHEVWVTNFETRMRHNVEQCTGKEYGAKYALPYYTEPKSSPNGGGGYVEVQGNNPDNPNHEKIAGYTVDKYPYILSTGRRIPVYFHSEHRQLPWCREQWPVPRLEVNPKDAEKLGLKQGDWAWIETPNGKIRQMVDIYEGIKPGVVNCEHQLVVPRARPARSRLRPVRLQLPGRLLGPVRRLRRSAAAWLPGQRVQGNAREQPVQQPRSLRRGWQGNHHQRNRSAPEGMGTHLRGEGLSMTRYTIAIDLNRCVGCMGCNTACKTVNEVPIGKFWNKVLRVGPAPHRKGAEFPDIEWYYMPAAVPALRESRMRKGLPDRSFAQARGRHRADRQGKVHRLPVLRHGVPVRSALPQRGRRRGREVHALRAEADRPGRPAPVRQPVRGHGQVLRRPRRRPEHAQLPRRLQHHAC